ncbi:MAG TPA: hypothetical protein PLE42_02475 [Candidatus Competibacteraceae bacterium]|nr:hypothetical protein [Candidatus Competibacteraceae bacterium]
MDTLSPPRPLFSKGGPGSGNHHHRGRHEQRGGSAPDPHHHLIEESLRAHAAPWRHVDFSPEAWNAEFPNGQAHTPIGDIKLGENQRDKLSAKARERYFGLIKPTLEAPTYMVFEQEPPAKQAERKAAGQSPERPALLKFFRAFYRPDNEIDGFCCVTIAKDSLEIMISAGPKRLRQIARAVKAGAILTAGTTLEGKTDHPRRSALTGETASPGREDGLNKAVSFEYLTAFDAESQQGVVICAWDLFKALIEFAPQEEPLLKRMPTTPAGARWITVHPGGNKDAKGIPVMVQETQHGSGVFHVIGGAGGKLNYLKMRGLKSEAEYLEFSLCVFPLFTLISLEPYSERHQQQQRSRPCTTCSQWRKWRRCCARHRQRCASGCAMEPWAGFGSVPIGEYQRPILTHSSNKTGTAIAPRSRPKTMMRT